MFIRFARNMIGPRARNSVRKRIERHLGGDVLHTETITHNVRAVERVNLDLVLDRWLNNAGRHNGRESPAGLVGYSIQMYESTGLADLAAGSDLFIAPVVRESLAIAPGRNGDLVERGIYLLRFDGNPIVAMVRSSHPPMTNKILDVMARDRQTARNAYTRLLDEAHRGNVYKGQVIALGESEHCWPREITIAFHELPATPREQIVLPEDVMTVLERNVLGLLRHGDALRASGRSTRHGVLLHGPPGTGKTLAVRYLARACPDHTVILLTGRQMGLIRESCHIAKLLAPSIVILEDVDLVARERDDNKHAPLLHDLMDEMDGLGTKAACIFLLTTNRPESIEPALSARPGRVDQAIAFPLPDDACRRRLFDLYGRGLDLAGVTLDRWIEQTDGVSPAFIQELLRKAALMSVERAVASGDGTEQTAQPLLVTDDDVASALRELVLFGGELTQKLLGYKSTSN
jgi:hypothetical protein